jgi:hypothetical protein
MTGKYDVVSGEASPARLDRVLALYGGDSWLGRHRRTFWVSRRRPDI